MSNVLSELRGHERTRECARAIGREALGVGSYAQAHLWSMVCVIVAVLVLLPGVALANQYDPQLVLSDFPIPGSSGKGYVCVDCNEFTATLALIGHESEFVQLTSEQYSQLSASGNSFSQVMSLWDSVGAGNAVTESLGSVVETVILLYGSDNVLAGIFTDAQISAANQYYLQVRDGTGGSGGGSGGSDDDGYMWLELQAYQDVVLDSSGFSLENGDSLRVRLPQYADLETFLSDYSDYNIYVMCGRSGLDNTTTNVTSLQITILALPDSWSTPRVLINTREDGAYAGYPYVMSIPSFTTSEKAYCCYFYASQLTYNNDVSSATCISEHIAQFNTSSSTTWPSTAHSVRYRKNLTSVFNSQTNTSYDFLNGSQNVNYYWVPLFGSIGEGTGGGGSEPMPDPEPDPDPETPDPTVPDPPDPTDPTTPTKPNPTTPTPPNPVDPTVIYPSPPDVTITNETFTADFSGILDAMDVHCRHLQQMMVDCSEYLADSLGAELLLQINYLSGIIVDNASYIGDSIAEYAGAIIDVIADYGDWFGDLLVTCFSDLYDYMGDCAQWLVDHLNYNANLNVEPYDDTSLMFWLRRIWAKLGDGDINTRPTDPVTQWDPWGEWLSQLVEYILGVLTGGIGGVVGNVVNAINTLSGVFPFCIPFDLLLLMDAITTEPVTPYISVTMPATDWYETFSIEVDCEVYDDAMEVVRSFELLAFVVYVMLHSKELFGWNAGEFSKFWSVGEPT